MSKAACPALIADAEEEDYSVAAPGVSDHPAVADLLRELLRGGLLRASQGSHSDHGSPAQGPTPLSAKHTSFVGASALQSSGRSCSPAPDLVLRSVIFPRVFSLFLVMGTGILRQLPRAREASALCIYIYIYIYMYIHI